MISRYPPGEPFLHSQDSHEPRVEVTYDCVTSIDHESHSVRSNFIQLILPLTSAVLLYLITLISESLHYSQ